MANPPNDGEFLIDFIHFCVKDASPLESYKKLKNKINRGFSGYIHNRNDLSPTEKQSLFENLEDSVQKVFVTLCKNISISFVIDDFIEKKIKEDHTINDVLSNESREFIEDLKNKVSENQLYKLTIPQSDAVIEKFNRYVPTIVRNLFEEAKRKLIDERIKIRGIVDKNTLSETFLIKKFFEDNKEHLEKYLNCLSHLIETIRSDKSKRNKKNLEIFLKSELPEEFTKEADIFQEFDTIIKNGLRKISFLADSIKRIVPFLLGKKAAKMIINTGKEQIRNEIDGKRETINDDLAEYFGMSKGYFYKEKSDFVKEIFNPSMIKCMGVEENIEELKKNFKESVSK